MAISLVATVTAGPGFTGGATSAIDTTGVTLVVIGASWWGGSTANVSFSDNKSNTWTLVTLQSSGLSSDMRHQFAYCFNPTVGTGHTFSVTGGGGYPAIVVHAFSGTAGYTYQTRSGAGGSASPLASGSVTPSANGALILTGYCVNNGTLPAGLAASGFAVTTKEGVGGVNFPGAAGYLVQTTAAAINPTWSWTSGTFETALSSVVFSPGAATSITAGTRAAASVLTPPTVTLPATIAITAGTRTAASVVTPPTVILRVDARATQVVAETLDTAPAGPARVSHAVIELLDTVPPSPERTTQVVGEVLFATVNVALVTQIAYELIVIGRAVPRCEYTADFPIEPDE